MFEQFRAWLIEPVITEVREGFCAMTSREQSAYANLNQTIENVRSGWASLVAERDRYKAGLEAADANQAQAVADALAADSEHDADAIEQADASLASLVTPVQPEPTPEPTPEPAREGDAPVTGQPAGDQPA